MAAFDPHLPDPSPTPRRGPRIAAVVGVILAVGLGAALLALAPDDPAAPDAAAVLRARATALEARLGLVGDERLYLLLEADRGALTLYQGGAVLRRWPVRAVATGARRVPVGRGGRRDDWRSSLWEGGRLDPAVDRERRIIVSDQVEAPDLTGAVEWVPPTPEEEVPTPERFVVRFEGGLGLEVEAPGADTLPHRPDLGRRLRGAAARLSPASWDRYRVRVVMDPADAGALYRGLPDGVAFLAILPEA